MNREELIEREVKSIDQISKDYLQHIESVVSTMRDSKVKLWLTKPDQYRLLTLKAWEIKYRVNTKTILQIILPFWESFIQRHSRKMKSQGLNVKVSTLTGKKSELILKDALQKLYPNRENISFYISNEKERIIQIYLKRLQKRSNDGIRSMSDPSSMYGKSGKVLTLLDFPSPEAFVKYYRKWIKKEQLAREKVELEMKKRAYRGNPYRQEYL